MKSLTYALVGLSLMWLDVAWRAVTRPAPKVILRCGAGTADIAEAYGISRAAVRDIRAGRTWAHLRRAA